MLFKVITLLTYRCNFFLMKSVYWTSVQNIATFMCLMLATNKNILTISLSGPQVKIYKNMCHKIAE